MCKPRPDNIFRRSALMSCGLLVLVTASAADPDDDLQAGLDAYTSGDLLTAMVKYRSAADAGSAAAQARLAWILDQSEENEAAVSLYRQSAEQGHAAGESGLAEMYAKGEGVEKDAEIALVWFTKAAENGHLPALRILISAYENGELGLSPDEAQTGRWLLRAAEVGDRASMMRLANVYRTGGLGIDINEQSAIQWEKRLAKSEIE